MPAPTGVHWRTSLAVYRRCATTVHWCAWPLVTTGCCVDDGSHWPILPVVSEIPWPTSLVDAAVGGTQVLVARHVTKLLARFLLTYIDCLKIMFHAWPTCSTVLLLYLHVVYSHLGGGLMLCLRFFLMSPISFENGWTGRNSDCCVNTIDEQITTAKHLVNLCQGTSSRQPLFVARDGDKLAFPPLLFVTVGILQQFLAQHGIETLHGRATAQTWTLLRIFGVSWSQKWKRTITESNGGAYFCVGLQLQNTKWLCGTGTFSARSCCGT